MRFSHAHLALIALLSSTVVAIDMKYYEQGAGIDDGFEGFCETFFEAIEDVTDNTAYVNYFSETSELKILDPPVYDIKSAANIGKLQKIAQVGKTWNHFLNKTKLLTDTTESQVIQIEGKLESHWSKYQNCSTSYITWFWTINKKSGKIDLTAQDHQVAVFWDKYVYPYQPNTPTPIPCTG